MFFCTDISALLDSCSRVLTRHRKDPTILSGTYFSLINALRGMEDFSTLRPWRHSVSAAFCPHYGHYTCLWMLSSRRPDMTWQRMTSPRRACAIWRETGNRSRRHSSLHSRCYGWNDLAVAVYLDGWETAWDQRGVYSFQQFGFWLRTGDSLVSSFAGCIWQTLRSVVIFVYLYYAASYVDRLSNIFISLLFVSFFLSILQP